MDPEGTSADSLQTPSELLLNGVEDMCSVEDVVILIEVEHCNVVRTGREIEVLINVCAEESSELGAIVPDLNLADWD